MPPDIELDEEALAEAAVALLSLTLHDGGRVWKSLDWTLMNLMHEKGWISDPVSKAKSVLLTTRGQRKARRVLATHFSKSRAPRATPRTRSTQEPVDADQLDNCIVMRCTAKLLKELRITPTDAPDKVPSTRDWHATLVRTGRRKSVLISHTQTLYTVVLLGVVQKNLKRLGEEFAALAKALLAADGLLEHGAVLPSSAPRVVYAKTNNRSALGSMNDLSYQLEVRLEGIRDVRSVEALAVNAGLNRIPMIGTLGGGYAVDAMAELLGATDSS